MPLYHGLVQQEKTVQTQSKKNFIDPRFFNYLKNKARIIDENPAADLESPKLLKNAAKALTLDESQQLLAKAAAILLSRSSRDYCILQSSLIAD
jgi:site-specific recombinase XerD